MMIFCEFVTFSSACHITCSCRAIDEGSFKSYKIQQDVVCIEIYF